MDLETIQVPAEFVELVRDALTHLYEPTHLVRHPLNALLVDALPPLGDAAQSLRLFILDTIERLQPADAARTSEKARRPYTVLVQRYVGGFSVDDIVAKLQIGPRQFRREHQKGLEALAAYLWTHCRQYRQGGGEASASSTANLLSEVETLGVELTSLPVAEILVAARDPAMALALHYGVGLCMHSGENDTRCLCDRTLAKQALLSCLSAILSRRPQYLTLTVTTAQRLPCIEMIVTPPFPGESVDSLTRELLEPQALVSAQGGGIKTLIDENGLGTGVRLSFRPTGTAQVLVVDDNEKMLRLYERYLMIGRYGVSTAASAQEAEAVLKKTTPDAIVLDVMMREVDGWEFMQRLRSRPDLSGVPIIVCSILNESTLALALGAHAYLRKPITADMLLATLHRVLK